MASSSPQAAKGPPAVTELEHIDPDSLTLRRWSLRFFSSDPSHAADVTQGFKIRNAQRYQTALRVTTIIFLVVNLILIEYDVSRFGNNFSSSVQLRAALIIRLGVMLPLCLGTVLFSYSTQYAVKSDWLLLPYTLLGVCLVTYSIIGENPGYGTLALFIVYMFSFSPLPMWLSTAAITGLLVSFTVALWKTESYWGQKLSNLDAGVSNSAGDPSVQMFNILGVLYSFAIIVGFIGHELEYSLKQSYLDELRLKLQTTRLKEEKEFATTLLDSMLPQQIIAQLQAGRTMIADSLQEVTVLFFELDLDTSKFHAATVVSILNIVFSTFDALVDERYVRKIETVASVWLGVSSPFIEEQEARFHAAHIADLAIGMAGAMPAVRAQISAETGINADAEIGFRIGLNSGPVAAGIVGIKNPRYKLIGDTVNTASRMESTCVGGRIQVSSACYSSLQMHSPSEYVLSPRGEIPVKGKGAMFTYWLEGLAGEPLVASVAATGGIAASNSHGHGAPAVAAATAAAPAAPVMSAAAQAAYYANLMLHRSATAAGANPLLPVVASAPSAEPWATTTDKGNISSFAKVQVALRRQSTAFLPDSATSAPPAAVGVEPVSVSPEPRRVGTLPTAALTAASIAAATAEAGATSAAVVAAVNLVAQRAKKNSVFGAMSRRAMSNAGGEKSAGGTTGNSVAANLERRYSLSKPEATTGALRRASLTRPENTLGGLRRISVSSIVDGGGDRRMSTASAVVGKRASLKRAGNVVMAAARARAASHSHRHSPPQSPVHLTAASNIAIEGDRMGTDAAAGSVFFDGDEDADAAAAEPTEADHDQALVDYFDAVNTERRPTPLLSPSVRNINASSAAASRATPSNNNSPVISKADPASPRPSLLSSISRRFITVQVAAADAAPPKPSLLSSISRRFNTVQVAAAASPRDRGRSGTASAISPSTAIFRASSSSSSPASGASINLASASTGTSGGGPSRAVAVERFMPPPLGEKGSAAGAAVSVAAVRKPVTSPASVHPYSGGAGIVTAPSALLLVPPPHRQQQQHSAVTDDSAFMAPLDRPPRLPPLPRIAASAVSIYAGSGSFASSRLAAGRQQVRGVQWADRLTLCFNRSVMRGGAGDWEEAFQRDMGVGWRGFARTTAMLLMGLLGLFSLQDWYKYGPSSTWPNKQYIWALIAELRYAVLLPLLLLYLLLTYTAPFRARWWVAQSATGVAVLATGLIVVSLSSVGSDPGYGVLALYLVYSLNVSLLALAFRFAILTCVIFAYSAVTVTANAAVVSPESAAYALLYLATFFIGEMCPVLLREYAVRQNYFRRFRIDIERKMLAQEKRKTTKLLENMLPPVIVPRLRGGLRRALIADDFADVTILWTDMKGFTDFSAARSPLEVVAFLNAMFSTFDRILDKHGVRKIEVLGDAFFCCAGVPLRTPDHAERCANAALEMLLHMPILRSFAGGADINMRIGLHTGPVIAGVVGVKDPRYHLFGDSVPYANAMESNGVPGLVHVSAATHAKLQARQEERARAFVTHVKMCPPPPPPVPVLPIAGGGGAGPSSSSSSSGASLSRAAAVAPPLMTAAEAAAAAARVVSAGGSYSLGKYSSSSAVRLALLDEYLMRQAQAETEAAEVASAAAEAAANSFRRVGLDGGGGGMAQSFTSTVAAAAAAVAAAAAGRGGSRKLFAVPAASLSPAASAAAMSAGGMSAGPPSLWPGTAAGHRSKGVASTGGASSFASTGGSPRLPERPPPPPNVISFLSRRERNAAANGGVIGVISGSIRESSGEDGQGTFGTATGTTGGDDDGGGGLGDDAAGGGGGDGEVLVAESGDAAVRGQMQLWRGAAFLGWDIDADMVQGAMLYAHLPAVTAAQQQPHSALSSARGEDAAALVIASARTDTGVGVVGDDDADADAEPVSDTMPVPAAATHAHAQTHAHAHPPNNTRQQQQQQQQKQLPHASSTRAVVAAAAAPPTSASSSHALLLMPWSRRQPQSSAALKPWTTAAVRGGDLDAPPHAAAAPPPPPVPVMMTSNGYYLPADPARVFGPGGGFFSLEERRVDIKGRGLQTTYFLGRADPPFLPELAASQAQLQGTLAHWGAVALQGPAEAASSPLGGRRGGRPRRPADSGGSSPSSPTARSATTMSVSTPIAAAPPSPQASRAPLTPAAETASSVVASLTPAAETAASVVAPLTPAAETAASVAMMRARALAPPPLRAVNESVVGLAGPRDGPPPGRRPASGSYSPVTAVTVLDDDEAEKPQHDNVTARSAARFAHAAASVAAAASTPTSASIPTLQQQQQQPATDASPPTLQGGSAARQQQQQQQQQQHPHERAQAQGAGPPPRQGGPSAGSAAAPGLSAPPPYTSDLMSAPVGALSHEYAEATAAAAAPRNAAAAAAPHNAAAAAAPHNAAAAAAPRNAAAAAAPRNDIPLSNPVASPTRAASGCAACGTVATKKCARCRTVYYCGPACQQQHWTTGGHEKACVPVAVAAGALATGAGAAAAAAPTPRVALSHEYAAALPRAKPSQQPQR